MKKHLLNKLAEETFNRRTSTIRDVFSGLLEHKSNIHISNTKFLQNRPWIPNYIC